MYSLKHQKEKRSKRCPSTGVKPRMFCARLALPSCICPTSIGRRCMSARCRMRSTRQDRKLARQPRYSTRIHLCAGRYAHRRGYRRARRGFRRALVPTRRRPAQWSTMQWANEKQANHWGPLFRGQRRRASPWPGAGPGFFGGPCWRPVWTPWGRRWRWVC